MTHSHKPTALIVTTAGINCDRELCQAFELAGARTESVHLNLLLRDPSLIDRYELIGLPGGFSYGDAVAAGRIGAHLMRERLYPAFVRAIQRGVPIVAPCNGFQMACQIGLLPGPAVGQPWPEHPPRPTVTLARNAGGRFIDKWVSFEVPANTRCIWTQGLELDPSTGLLPIAHAQGRFVATDGDQLEVLADNGQVAARYLASDNPNGSQADIAGICDTSGLVFGLMPHPERYTQWSQHPFWTRLDGQQRGETPGLTMFRNAVAHVRSVNGAAV